MSETPDTAQTVSQILPEMTEEEAALADAFYAAMMSMTRESERSQQAKEYKVGVSDIGFCSERTRRMLMGLNPGETDMLLAWLGTAIGDHAEQAWMRNYPEWIRQAEVTVQLAGDQRTYNISGHPDLLGPGVVLDVKSDYGLSSIQRTGPTRQQWFQRNLYAKGAHEKGLLGDVALEDVKVGNVWIDRAGIDRRVHVDLKPYDPAAVVEAAEWLDEVVYAYLQTAEGVYTEAQKEPPREMCAVVCGFYEECRAFDTDVEGLLTDPVVLDAIQSYGEGLSLGRKANKLKDEGKAHLQGISGSTGEWMVRWTWVNEQRDDEGNLLRRGYNKLDVRPLKGGRK